jgi:orotidine-5'-phosphate decarboxylase
MNSNPILLAIDTNDLCHAKHLSQTLYDHIGGIKLGLEFFCAHGPHGVREVADDLPLFLDLKLHDIPNTVARAIRAILPLQPSFVTVHCAGGDDMLGAAVEAADEATGRNQKRPLILGVTVLTSLPANPQKVIDYARRAYRAGLDGVICSPNEVASLRMAFGPDFLIVTPGIRPEGGASGDQVRIGTPREALRAGADYLVIGRPITAADDPVTAAKAISESIALADVR